MYRLLRPMLFSLDPESVHEMALRRLEHLQKSRFGRSLLRDLAGATPSAPTSAMGMTFRHRLGLAAGFDKDARTVLALQELGFAFVEVGTVTPRAQEGNPRPRLWRFPEAHALVNSLGFPSEGMSALAQRLQEIRDRGWLRIPVGINLGKNRDTPLADAADDYLTVLTELHSLGDYFVVNVSSPNTPGLRELQNMDSLQGLLSRIVERATALGSKPLLVKIAPDLTDEEITAIGRLTRQLGLTGIIAGNTTIQREVVPGAARLDRGGLSGLPLFSRTKEMIRLLRAEMSVDQTVIAAGGVFSAEHVQECIHLGADLVQIYTSFVYLGPRCVRQLVRPSPESRLDETMENRS